jgi:hypothetical protein
MKHQYQFEETSSPTTTPSKLPPMADAAIVEACNVQSIFANTENACAEIPH